MAPRSSDEEGDSTTSEITRRSLLAGGASTLAIGGVGTAVAQEAGPAMVPDYGGWFGADARGGETASFEGTADRRGEDEVTITVGASGNGGTFSFSPTAVWVDPETTVTFEWESNTHNVAVESQPDGADWNGHESIEDAGFAFDHTFEAGGIYTYFCSPHLGQGMKGAIAVGDDVPMRSPQPAGGGFTLPGGDIGTAFMGVLLGTVGVAAAIVLAGEAHGSVTDGSEGPTSAHTTALVLAILGGVVLLAVVARLLVG